MEFQIRAALMLASGVALLNPVALSGAEVKRAADSSVISFVEPLVGHVFDPAKKQIRTILGIPGAARVADAVPLNTTLENVVIAAGGKLAIASVTDGDSSVLVRPFDDPPAAIPIPGSMKFFMGGAFSPAGTSTVLFGSDCNCVQVVGGFGDSPSVSHVIDATTLPGDITAVAVNDDASLAAVSVAGLSDGSQPAQVFVFNFNGDSQPRAVLSSTASALAFSPSGTDLAVADTKTHSLVLVQNAAADATVVNVAGEADGLSMPSAVTFMNPNVLLVADRAGQVEMVSLQGDPMKSIACNCRPTAMEPMALKSTYRLTDTLVGAVWILTLTDSDATVRFVPVDSEDSDNTQTGTAQ
jgi:hypothetical protein